MRAADKTAEIIITAGGLSVIVAVLGIIAYLAAVTIPLLSPGRAEVRTATDLPQATPLAAVMDEYQVLIAGVHADGVLRTAMPDRAGALQPVAEMPLALSETPSGPEPAANRRMPAGQVSAVALDADSGLFAAATDSVVVQGSLAFRSAVSDSSSLDAPLAVGERVVDGDAVLERLAEDQYRRVSLGLDLAFEQRATDRVTAIDVAASRQGPRVAVWHTDGTGHVLVSERPRGLMAQSAGVSVTALEVPPLRTTSPVVAVQLVLDARQLVVVAEDGSLERFAIGRRGLERAGESVLTADGARVTVVAPVLGRRSIVVGSSDGRVAVWTIAKDPANADSEGALVLARETRLPEGTTAEVIVPSLRDRTMFIGDSGGSIHSWHATSGKTVFRLDTGIAGPVETLAVGPKLDSMLAFGGDRAILADLDVGHPEATPNTLFFPVLYEGQSEPSFVYQASSAEDDAEPKLSLTPLMFGTIKATVFSLLFALPIAVLAAIYTSEFMAERHRRYVKPSIEMMASLPSVVLGFVAAMVVAPFIRDHLTSVLTAMFLAPLAALIAAGCWALVPRQATVRVGSLAVLAMALVSGVVGILGAWSVSSPVEQWLFAPSDNELSVLAGLIEPAEEQTPGAFEVDGSWFVAAQPESPADAERLAGIRDELTLPGSTIKNWLGGVIGDAGPGWLAILTPLATLLVGTLGWGLLIRSRPGITEARLQPLIQIGSSLVIGVALAALFAWALTEAGLDARDMILGAFTQRNTLVVGIIMGFAIIPIIYTISDDAMRSVPLSLKAASLGAGATQWQTAIRIVLPVAASGIFSAAMIGLGRAVGETMIVLMATGNTPVMDWSLFSGLRTLSANIAVELPEAERGGTHYRLLFLCGVVLFVMTFIVNTTAEIVRQHFRKRNALL